MFVTLSLIIELYMLSWYNQLYNRHIFSFISTFNLYRYFLLFYHKYLGSKTDCKLQQGLYFFADLNTVIMVNGDPSNGPDFVVMCNYETRIFSATLYFYTSSIIVGVLDFNDSRVENVSVNFLCHVLLFTHISTKSQHAEKSSLANRIRWLAAILWTICSIPAWYETQLLPATWHYDLSTLFSYLLTTGSQDLLFMFMLGGVIRWIWRRLISRDQTSGSHGFTGSDLNEPQWSAGLCFIYFQHLPGCTDDRFRLYRRSILCVLLVKAQLCCVLLVQIMTQRI